MARIARLKVKGEPAVYHVISRTTLHGFVLGDVEKDHLPALMKRLSDFYFAEVLGFSILGNHFHLLVRMHPPGYGGRWLLLIVNKIAPAILSNAASPLE